jgi:predicted dithiol-disulfide oxidoreductase (DUF899 family)
VATPPQASVILNLFQDNRRPIVILNLFQDNSQPIVILNLFQDNRRRWCVILKQVQDDDIIGDGALNHIQHDDGWRFLHTPLRSAA